MSISNVLPPSSPPSATLASARRALDGSRWNAAGVRHAVLLRILPVLSHDLATPVTVLRMTTVVLRRKLAAGPPYPEDCVERIAALERQTDALTRALKQLLGWGVGTGESEVTRPELLSGCLALLRPVLRLRGIRFELEPVLNAEVEQSAAQQARVAGAPLSWPGASSLRYLLLASICHLHDTRPNLECIGIGTDGDAALRLSAFPTGPLPQLQPPPHDAAFESDDTAACLDAAALECLARELGRRIDFDEHGQGVRLGLAAV